MVELERIGGQFRYVGEQHGTVKLGGDLSGYVTRYRQVTHALVHAVFQRSYQLLKPRDHGVETLLQRSNFVGGQLASDAACEIALLDKLKHPQLFAQPRENHPVKREEDDRRRR